MSGILRNLMVGSVLAMVTIAWPATFAAAALRDGPIAPPSLLLSAGGVEHAAPLLTADYSSVVSGGVVWTRIRQRFVNDGEQTATGRYFHPLPANVYREQWSVKVGEKQITGRLHDRDGTESVGRAALRAAQAAGPGLAIAISELDPRQTVDVSVDVYHTLEFAAGRSLLQLPLAAETTDLDQARLGIHVELNLTEPPADLAAAAFAFRQRQSEVGSSMLDFEPAGERSAALALSWREPSRDTLAASAVDEIHAGEHYAALRIVAPRAQETQALPRDVVFLVDTSASAGIDAVLRVRDALLTGLSTLRPIDRMNAIRFATGNGLLFPDLRSATAANLGKAAEFLHAFDAAGGTDMYPALNAALHQFRGRRPDAVPQLILIADGQVANQRALLELLHSQRYGAHLFTVALGADADTQFLRAAALAGGGTFSEARDPAATDAVLTALLHRLASPVMTQLRLSWPRGAEPTEVFPQPLPDLLTDEPLLISWRGGLPSRPPVLSGRRADGRWTELVAPVVHKARGTASLWARMRTDQLLAQPHEPHVGDTIYDAVVAVAHEHGLATRYTRLVGMDGAAQADVVAANAFGDRTQPRWPAAAVAQQAVFFAALVALALVMARVRGWNEP